MVNTATASVGQVMVDTTTSHILTQPMPRFSALQKTSEKFDEWFSRCRDLLQFTAYRVLGGPEGAELAVQNCWRNASRNSPKFDREGEFRSWLVRVLIDA